MFGFAFEAFQHYYHTWSSLLILALFMQCYPRLSQADVDGHSFVTLIPIDCSTIRKDCQFPIQPSVDGNWWKFGLFPLLLCFLFSLFMSLPVHTWRDSPGVWRAWNCWVVRCIWMFKFTRQFQIVFQNDSVNLYSHWLCTRSPLSPQPPPHLCFQTA